MGAETLNMHSVTVKESSAVTNTHDSIKSLFDVDADKIILTSTPQFDRKGSSACSAMRLNKTSTQLLDLEDGLSTSTDEADLDMNSDVESEEEILRQLMARPISYDHLALEIEDTYAELRELEVKSKFWGTKCHAKAREMDNKEWKELIGWHAALLAQYYDFSMASQHPSGGTEFSRLTLEYSMPSRTCQHVMASLDVLFVGLPESEEHMFSLIYHAYSMKGLLSDTVVA